VFLKLDFDRSQAELNGIHGSIRRNPETGSSRIDWVDLMILGTPTIVMHDFGGTLIAGLRFQDHTADFICRAVEQVNGGAHP
jgi:hypothetical protein